MLRLVVECFVVYLKIALIQIRSFFDSIRYIRVIILKYYMCLNRFSINGHVLYQVDAIHIE